MTWSIVDVARMSGVTARTLRHYDAIGLVPPAEVGANGYRRYGRDELLRLQEVLVLRELGLGLGEIAEILARRRDRVGALRDHHARLLHERQRLGAVADTVARTIARLEEEGTTMGDEPEALFEGFDQARYAAEAQERWPAEYARSKAFADSLSEQDARRLQQDWVERLRRMRALQDAGASADDPRVQREVDGIFRDVSRFWEPNAESFAGLGRLYVDDERFARTFAAVGPGVAEYCRDAMVVYAAERLAG